MKIKKLATRAESYILLIIVLIAVLISFAPVSSCKQQHRGHPSLHDCSLHLCAVRVPGLISTGRTYPSPMIAALSSYAAVEISLRTPAVPVPVVLVFLIAMVFGALMGCLNGFLIVKFKFPASSSPWQPPRCLPASCSAYSRPNGPTCPQNLFDYAARPCWRSKNPGTGLAPPCPPPSS